MNKLSVALPWVLFQNYMILHEEVRDVIVEIDIFTNDVESYELLATMD